MHCMVKQEQPPAYLDARVADGTQSPRTTKPRSEPWGQFWPCRPWGGCTGFQECCWDTCGRCSSAICCEQHWKEVPAGRHGSSPTTSTLGASMSPLAAAPCSCCQSQLAFLTTGQISGCLGHHSRPTDLSRAPEWLSRTASYAVTSPSRLPAAASLKQ